MNRHAVLLIALSTLLPMTASAQDARLRGNFVRTLAPAAGQAPATGEARLSVDADGRVRVDLVVSGMAETPTVATLHTGGPGDPGELVARMDVIADGDGGRVIGGTADLSPVLAQRVRDGGAYVLIHTSEHPGGILRAQLLPQARTLGEASTAETTTAVGQQP